MGLIQQVLGIGAHAINWYQAAARAVLIYIAALAMVQVGERRFFGQHTTFDVVLGIILGSLISSVINNLDSVTPTIFAGFVLVGMHWLFSLITYKSNRLDRILKGETHHLVENGQIRWDQMRKNYITQNDLEQQMRTEGHTDDLSTVKEAYYERSGDISVIPFSPPPRIVEVKVEDGVQTVRIVIDP